MRIGIVTGEYPPMQGGVGAYTAIMVHRMSDLGHDVFIYCGPDSDETDSRIPLTHSDGRWGMRTIEHVAYWARQNRLDIVNLQFQTAAFRMSPWVHFLPRWLTMPFITTFHDLRAPYLFPKAGPLRTWIVRHLAQTSAGLIVTNHEDRLQVADLSSRMIPIGSNISIHPTSATQIEQRRMELGIAADERLIGYFGFMNHSKGVDILLEAVAASSDDLNLKIILLGGQTGASDPTNIAYSRFIADEIKRLGLSARVYSTGYLDDKQLSESLQACDVIALPFRDGASFRRGSLMAAIEHQCAIITTEPAIAVPEFINRDNLLLVPPGDAKALADALTTLTYDHALAKSLREGANTLKKNFNWEAITQETISFFQDVLSKASGSRVKR